MGLSVALLASAAAVSAGIVGVSGAQAAPQNPRPTLPPASQACGSGAYAVGYSDALDKVTTADATLGGLSSLAYDRRSASWLSTVDNHASDPSRVWSFTDLAAPKVTGAPLVLKRPDGTAYDGKTADQEGLAVLPNGTYAISSEAEPSIRIYSRAGVQQASLPVPARFAVTGTTAAGEATSNATLESLTITPNGHQIIAAMEGALSGDVSAAGDDGLHRFLVYGADGKGGWKLTKQVAYRTEPGARIPEITAYRDNAVLVEEASFDAATGNSVKLFAVPGFDRAPDVSAITDLSTAPVTSVAAKQAIVDVVACPTLGAVAKQVQANPLMDNYEAMAVTAAPRPGSPLTEVALVSDDNFGATQITRVLRLALRLPG